MSTDIISVVNTPVAVGTIGDQIEIVQLPGPPGPPGPPGVPFVHIQATASTTWTVVHGLGHRPVVEVTDNTGRTMICDTVAVDINTAQLTFLTAQTGRAALI